MSRFILVAVLMVAAASHAAERRDEGEPGRTMASHPMVIEYRGLSHQRFEGFLIRKRSLSHPDLINAAVAVPVGAVQGNSVLAGAQIAQAVPMSPGVRGCGLLRVSIPRVDDQLASLDFDPDRQTVLDLRSTEGYSKVEEVLRTSLDAAWAELEGNFSALKNLVDEIAAGILGAESRADELGGQACELAQLANEVIPAMANWNSICKGSVPDETYEWCVAERRRLEPKLRTMNQGDNALRAATQEFADTRSGPLTEKHDEAKRKYAIWREGVGDARVQTAAALALTLANTGCRNTVNIHFQMDGSHEYLPPVSGNAVNATVEMAVAHLERVSEAYHRAYAGNARMTRGLGHATNEARVWLRKASSPPSNEKDFVFSPKPNGGWYLRLDVVINGDYPCPETAGKPGV